MKNTADGQEFFVNLVIGYRSAKVVQVGHALGVFALLEQTPRSAEDVARGLGTDAHATLVLLRSLAALGLLRLEDGRFHNGPVAAAQLVPGKPQYLGANLRYQELLWDGWSGLEQTVKTGKPQAGLVDRLANPAFSEEYLRSVENVSRASARELVEAFRLAPPKRLLDVGSGLGTYSAAFAEAFPELEATLFDLPSTLALAQKALADHAARGRLKFQTGNYLRDDFETGYDLVLFSHVTHDESHAVNASLLSKAYAALRPGGRVLIHDFVVQDDGCGPLFAALFSVNMLVYTNGGQVYSEADYRGLLEGAGFSEVTSLPVLAQRTQHGTRAIIARRAG